MPEIVAPVGNIDKLPLAVAYGADAVYLAGQQFGLRYGADNFSFEQLDIATKYCRRNKIRIFVTLNIFPLSEDIKKLPNFINQIKDMPIDAFVCSDFGTISIVKNNCNIPIHVSTQISTMNSEQALLFKELGAKRIVLSRELSIKEAVNIKKKSGLEIELFIHGSMCSAISGQCILSNYQNGRDSNRGGCIQNCRFQYQLKSPTNNIDNFSIGSKDLLGLDLLQEIIDCEIDAIKIEGRMKSSLYLATVVSTYRQAIDNLKKNKKYPNNLHDRLKLLHNRNYWSGYLNKDLIENSISSGISDKHTIFAGQVLKYDFKNKRILFSCANRLKIGDKIDFLKFNGEYLTFQINKMKGIDETNQNNISSARVVWLESPDHIAKGTVARFNKY